MWRSNVPAEHQGFRKELNAQHNETQTFTTNHRPIMRLHENASDKHWCPPEHTPKNAYRMHQDCPTLPGNIGFSPRNRAQNASIHQWSFHLQCEKVVRGHEAGPRAHRERLGRTLQNPEAEDGGEAVGDRGARGHGGPDEARRHGSRLAADDVYGAAGDEAAGAEEQGEAEGRQQPCGRIVLVVSITRE